MRAFTRDKKVNMDVASLYEHFTALGPMSKKTFDAFLALGEERRLAKHAFWSRPGEPVRAFAVVLEGLVRHYYVDPKGRESVKAFRGPGELSAPYAEIILKKPSRTFIQALAPTRLLSFDVERFEALAGHSLEVSRLARRFVELHFVGKEQREYEFLQLSAEERYRKFCAEQPQHLNQIPQHQVASYIGITPVALSRIRARVARRT